MALFDFLKRKKEVEKAKQGKKLDREAGNVQEKIYSKPESSLKRTSGFFYESVDQPHISEKANYLMEKDQYIFKVPAGYNKNEIKKSVEGIYGVNVLSVNIIKIPAKKRGMSRRPILLQPRKARAWCTRP